MNPFDSITPSDVPLYRSRKREKRRAGFLSVLSVVLILVMVSFELGAVLFVRYRLGLPWALDERKQSVTTRLDEVRKSLRRWKPPAEPARAERDWISRELNIACGYYRDYEYSISAENLARYDVLTALIEQCWTERWSVDSWWVQEKRLSFDHTRELLKNAR